MKGFREERKKRRPKPAALGAAQGSRYNERGLVERDRIVSLTRRIDSQPDARLLSP